MKLNIGCGKTYKEGYINIDAFDSTVADKIMSANDLIFSSNSIDEIQSIQLIEHIGLFNAIYALSEWFRVLKPGGNLIIETPNIEKSFKKFINGDLDTRKNLITWIYGIESEGMAHKFCFPEELLEEQLKKIGFVNVEKTYKEIEKDHPTIRIKCNKKKDFKQYQMFCDFRKNLFKKNIVDTNDYYLAIEQEKLIDTFTDKFNEFMKKKDYDILNEITIEGSVHSPIITYTFLNECLKHRLVSKDKINKNIKVLDFLININYNNILEYLIKESSDIAGTQNRVYQTVCNLGKQTVKKLLSEKNSYSIKKSLMKLSKECKDNKTVFFSYDLMEKKASIYSSIGIKEFILGNIENSIKYMKEAIKLDRNYFLYYWNLARLLSMTGNLKDSKKIYENAIKSIRITKFKNKESIEKILKKEIDNFSIVNHGKPVTKLLE